MIVGIAGKAGAGKDLAAKALIQRGWFKYSFAQPIRDGIEAMFGISQEDMLDPVIKNQANFKYGHSIRSMMQLAGTEFARNMIHPDVWILRGLEICQNHENVVISDCRFPNEAEAIRSSGGIVIEIIRDDNEYHEAVTMNGVVAHASESGLPRYLIDYVVYNNSDVETLWKQINQIVDNHAK